MKKFGKHTAMNRIELKIFLVLVSLGTLLSHNLNAQQTACFNDTVKIAIDEYRGAITWQKSTNGTDWTNLDQEEGDTISLIAAEDLYVRLEVLEGTCMPVYSYVMSVSVNEIPEVTFVSRDSACLNERDFILTGGLPEGGVYSGPGVRDNKFNPADAGAGIHELKYSYTNPETLCSNISYSQIEVYPLTSKAEAGEDFDLIMSDSVQLNANQPAYGVGTWTVSSGIGGYFSDIHDPNSWFIKDSSNLEYELTWTIDGTCGSDSDNVSVVFMELSNNPCPGTPVVYDADGNRYKTVQVGDQCWMAENLRTGVFVESTETSSNHSDLKDNGIIEKYCFENNPDSCLKYGGLYDWYEAMGYSDEEGVQGVCPDGWHLPSNDDWADLDAQFRYGDAGEQLKEDRESGWEGQFAGDRHQRGAFYSLGSSGFFWSSTTYTYMGADEGYFRKISACNGALEDGRFNKVTGLSVRCVKDE